MSCVDSALNSVKQLLTVPGQKCHTLQGKQLDPGLGLGNLIYSFGTAYKVQCLLKADQPRPRDRQDTDTQTDATTPNLKQSHWCSSTLNVVSLQTCGKSVLHSSKILMIQQGQPWGVSSVGNPRQAPTGFNSGSSISHKVCRIF